MTQTSDKSDNEQPRPTFGAGAAGLSIGTIIAVATVQLPETSPAKPWLVAFTPTITLAISLGWIQARAWVVEALDHRSTTRAFQDARQALLEGPNNLRTSQKHKDQLRQDLEQLERDYIKSKTSPFGARLR